MPRDIFSLYWKLCCINTIHIESNGLWRELYSALQEEKKEEDGWDLMGDSGKLT